MEPLEVNQMPEMPQQPTPEALDGAQAHEQSELDKTEAQKYIKPILPEEEQSNIVSLCNQFKTGAMNYARDKKEVMRRCYAYSKSRMYDQNDMLPKLDVDGADGDDRSAKSGRPEVFIPLSRQQFKLLYSHLRLTLFATDKDYFRLKGKSARAAHHEENLTEGVKYIFRENLIQEYLIECLSDAIKMGIFAAWPQIDHEKSWEWGIDTEAAEYTVDSEDIDKRIFVEIMNPLNFYLEPKSKSRKRMKSKWVYVDTAKLSELKECPYYFNMEGIESLAREEVQDTASKDNQNSLSRFNNVQQVFVDIEDNIDVDYYYFPYLKTNTREYRNILVTVAAEQRLIELRPNMMPKGVTPAVYQTWMDDKETPYGTSPIEDIMELQRLMNILSNYLVETMARIGNRFIAKEGVDFTNFFGVAGGVATTDDPDRDIRVLTGDYGELQFLMNYIGTIKSEAQMLAGSQDPFQGSSQIDFKKTATEMQILAENAVSVVREITEHIGVGIQEIMQRLIYLVADNYKEPMTIRVEDPIKGTQYIQVDFSLLKKLPPEPIMIDGGQGGQIQAVDPATGMVLFQPEEASPYTVELVGMNPSQSKNAQVESLMQLVSAVSANPQMIFILEPIIVKIGLLQGIKDIQETVDDIKATVQGFMGQQGGSQGGRDAQQQQQQQ